MRCCSARLPARAPCPFRRRHSKRRSALTAKRSRPICAASAPGGTPRSPDCERPPSPAKRHKAPGALTSDLEAEIAVLPAAAQEVIAEGVRRLTAYQDGDYARLYLDRLQAIREADAHAAADGRLLTATARQLALRMSYEDVIRVAEAKIDPARVERIARELAVKPGQIVTVTEFLKPGIDELCSILPPWLATAILKLAE